MQLYVGNYAGNGTDNRSITGVGFQPHLVIVMAREARSNVAKNADMSGDGTVFIGHDGTETTDAIQAFETDGFQVGTFTDVNQSGLTYDFIAVRDNSAGDFAYGVYTGNGTDDRNVVTGLSFQPDLVVVKRRNGSDRAVIRHKDQTGDNTLPVIESSSQSNLIQAFNSDGFQVGSDNRVNGNTFTYMWFAFKEASGIVKISSYTGNGTDDRNITGVGFDPEIVWHKDNNGTDGHFLSASAGMSVNQTKPFSGFGWPLADNIQDLITDGFQVGTDRVNTSSSTNFYVCFRTGTSGGGAAGVENWPILRPHSNHWGWRY